MVYWETAHTVRNQPQFVLDFASQWQEAEKIVYSRTLVEPRSARTRIEREFDLGAVRRLKAGAEHDITVDGPELGSRSPVRRLRLIDVKGVERHPLTAAPALCKQLYESAGKSLPQAKSEKLMKSREPVCS